MHQYEGDVSTVTRQKDKRTKRQKDKKTKRQRDKKTVVILQRHPSYKKQPALWMNPVLNEMNQRLWKSLPRDSVTGIFNSMSYIRVRKAPE